MSRPGTALLDLVTRGGAGAFALLHRPATTGAGTVEIVLADAPVAAPTLAQVPLDASAAGPERHEALVLVPFRQLRERGFEAVDDAAPLLTLPVRDQGTVTTAELVARVPDDPAVLCDLRLVPDDATYEQIVADVVEHDIGTGQGANFVVRRTFRARMVDPTPQRALAVFRRLLQQERGAYWTFLVHTGDTTFVGASPERHVSVEHGLAVMNPISGTYRYPPGGPSVDGVMSFLADRKEIDELYMVVDEELKMMSRLSAEGGRVVGPFLKEMAHVAHTEYLVEARTRCDVREVLHETLFAPTVTGSPLQNACRVIRRHEPDGRGYYAGVLALVGTDGAGGRRMDSTILIRTAQIDADGDVRVGVGATIVAGSDPASESAETRAKATALLAAITGAAHTPVGGTPAVRDALRRRNEGISAFWLRDAAQRAAVDPGLRGLHVLVVDAEDTFTSMIAHQLRALGMRVDVRRCDEDPPVDAHDLVVMGPGPGDPRDEGDPRIRLLRGQVARLLDARRPCVAVCLSHQVLSDLLGLPLVRLPRPHQGTQELVDLFGSAERVGFYNTYCAWSPDDRVDVPGVGRVEVSRVRETGHVHALRGPGFASMQFHPESILTHDGPGIVARAVRHALGMHAAQPVGAA